MIESFVALCLIAFGMILGMIANERKHRGDRKPPQATEVDEHATHWMKDHGQ